MEFRTIIDVPKKPLGCISHDDSIVMLGSCFTDNVGALLLRDGFVVTYNPMGPLYNPASILNAIRLALQPGTRDSLIIAKDADNIYHCLNFASRYCGPDEALLRKTVGEELESLRQKLIDASVVIITLGTAYVFSMFDSVHKGYIVGNCHKFPSKYFERYLLSVENVSQALHEIISLFGGTKRVIFTVSPIRHTADTLHGNQISKATLHLGLQNTLDANEDRPIIYFPAYEILLDDLRDYRFYAEDMKHPSSVAVDYIYETFAKYFFTDETTNKAIMYRKEALRKAHRQIIK